MLSSVILLGKRVPTTSLRQAFISKPAAYSPFPSSFVPLRRFANNMANFQTGTTIIDTLTSEHRLVEDLHKKFMSTADNELKQSVANEIIRKLSVHDAIECMVLYPAIKKHLKDQDMHDHGLSEHRQVRENLYRLDQMKVTDQGYTELLNQTMQDVTHHVGEEEKELFPKLSSAVDQETLLKLGHQLETARMTAPTRPHPAAPDTMPGIALAGAAAMPMDKLKDTQRNFDTSLEGERPKI